MIYQHDIDNYLLMSPHIILHARCHPLLWTRGVIPIAPINATESYWQVTQIVWQYTSCQCPKPKYTLVQMVSTECYHCITAVRNMWWIWSQGGLGFNLPNYSQPNVIEITEPLGSHHTPNRTAVPICVKLNQLKSRYSDALSQERHTSTLCQSLNICNNAANHTTVTYQLLISMYISTHGIMYIAYSIECQLDTRMYSQYIARTDKTGSITVCIVYLGFTL